MRKNQVTISVIRTGDQVPECRRFDSKTKEKVAVIELSTYADSNNVFEALAAAYSNIIERISEEEKVPSFGVNGGVVTKVKAYYPEELNS